MQSSAFLPIFVTACVLALGTACGSDSKNSSASSGGGGGAGGDQGASGGNASGGSVSACATPPDLGVRFVGRVDGCDPRGARYYWSGSGFVGRFNGTGVSVKLGDTSNQHTVLIDGELQPTLKTTTSEQLYPLATDLPAGEHTFEVYRRTEASFGITLVESFEVSGGELLAPPAAPTRRIEVFGDSITCGYGDEGALPCTFGADTENHYGAYASVLARSLDAELHTVAFSGKGVIYNYNGDKQSPLPTMLDRVGPDDRKNLWSFAWKPDAVIINLGTNDFSTSNGPTNELFTEQYQTLLTRLRGYYPDAFILCTVGPMLTGGMLSTTRTNIAAAVAARVAAGDTRVKAYEMTTLNAQPVGCDWHPNLATQEAMATELEPQLKSELGW
ncbi:MAG: SGNH/GDSL hydrolase family protein [Polyangiaceae bacterium]